MRQLDLVAGESRLENSRVLGSVDHGGAGLSACDNDDAVRLLQDESFLPQPPVECLRCELRVEVFADMAKTGVVTLIKCPGLIIRSRVWASSLAVDTSQASRRISSPVTMRLMLYSFPTVYVPTRSAQTAASPTPPRLLLSKSGPPL
jgi:hypothetical protein